MSKQKVYNPKPIAEYSNGEMKKILLSISCPMGLVDDMIQETRLLVIVKYGKDTEVPGSLVMECAKQSIQENSKPRIDNSLIRNNVLHDADGTEREFYSSPEQPTQTETVRAFDVAFAALAKFICAQPAGIKFGKATISGDPDQISEYVFTNEEIGWLILEHVWRLLENFGHDRYGLVNAMRRRTVWIGNDNENNPEYKVEFDTLRGFYENKFKGSHVTYKMLTTAKIKLDEKEREIFVSVFNCWKLEAPETEDFSNMIRPKGHPGNLNEQIKFYTVTGFHTIDKVTGSLIWHSRKSKKFYNSRPNFKKFPHIGFKRAI